MSVIVEAVESVVDAVDKYIVEPIANDPLTFVATMAAAYFGGPLAASTFGVSGAVGAGIAAGVGNTAAGLAQGEDFDEAIKGGAIAGLTTWGASSLSGVGGNQPTSQTAALQKGIASTADDFGSAALQSTDDILGSVAKQSADDFLNPGSSSYFSPTTGGAPYGGNASMGLADDVLSLSDDAFAKGAPTNPFTPTSVTPPPAPTTAPTTTPSPSTGAGVYTGSNLGTNTAADLIDDAAASSLPRAATDPLYYRTFDGSAPVTPGVGGINQGILESPIMQYGTGDVSRGIMNSPTPSPQPTMWDKALGYGTKAFDWAVDNPQYSVPLALGAASLLGQDKPEGPPSGGSQGQIGSPDFYEPLDLYRMNRGQLGYEGDIYTYGTQGGEHDFFSPTVYEPIRYAEGGNVQPARDEYGYYTYGQIPKTMRKFAKGGLSALATQGGFDGRSDDIPAVLSDGEFVIDAETVALLGNGSSKAGANKLEQMRQAVRKQKGGALSQGKFSPDAKSPLEYLKSSKRGRG
jgi:hypothetical protein